MGDRAVKSTPIDNNGCVYNVTNAKIEQMEKGDAIDRSEAQKCKAALELQKRLRSGDTSVPKALSQCHNPAGIGVVRTKDGKVAFSADDHYFAVSGKGGYEEVDKTSIPEAYTAPSAPVSPTSDPQKSYPQKLDLNNSGQKKLSFSFEA